MSATVTTDEFQTIKDPDEVLDYTIDYGGLLGLVDPVDTIVNSSWAIAQYTSGIDLTIDSISNDSATATVWLSGGGKLNTYHRVTNHITTAGGRVHERSILIWIQTRGGVGSSSVTSIVTGATGPVGPPGADGEDLTEELLLRDEYVHESVSLSSTIFNPHYVLVGDSISTYLANVTGRGDMLVEQWRIRLTEIYGEGNFILTNRAIGGTKSDQINQLVPDPNGSPAIPWGDGVSTWGQLIVNIKPDFLIVSFGMNDGAKLDYNTMEQFEGFFNSNLDVSPTYLYCTNLLPSTSNNEPQQEAISAAGARRSWAKFKERALIDFNRVFVCARDGVDPVQGTLKTTDVETVTRSGDNRFISGIKKSPNYMASFNIDFGIMREGDLDIVTVTIGQGPLDWVRISRVDTDFLRIRLDTGSTGDPAGGYVNDATIPIPIGVTALRIEVNADYVNIWDVDEEYGQYTAPLFSSARVAQGGNFSPAIYDPSSTISGNVTYNHADNWKYRPFITDEAFYNGTDGNGSSVNHPGNYTAYIYRSALKHLTVDHSTGPGATGDEFAPNYIFVNADTGNDANNGRFKISPVLTAKRCNELLKSNVKNVIKIAVDMNWDHFLTLEHDMYIKMEGIPAFGPAFRPYPVVTFVDDPDTVTANPGDDTLWEVGGYKTATGLTMLLHTMDVVINSKSPRSVIYAYTGRANCWAYLSSFESHVDNNAPMFGIEYGGTCATHLQYDIETIYHNMGGYYFKGIVAGADPNANRWLTTNVDAAWNT